MISFGVLTQSNVILNVNLRIQGHLLKYLEMLCSLSQHSPILLN